jgi:ABC-type amino acid transport substrate-binding protein
MTKFIVRLTPLGIFAIAAYAAGTLDVEKLHRIEVYLLTYVAFALLLSLWILPGLVAVLTPIGAGEMLSANRDALLTAFLVGDLFIVLPSLIESCSRLLALRIGGDVDALPGSVVPTSFTFPHAGKLLSASFVLFAGWFADAPVPLVRYPELALSGLLSFFGSLNVAVPFLLDLFRIPADTFQLFVATSVVNQRFGTLLAAVHTIAVALLGSAAIAGRIRLDVGRLLRYLALSAALVLTTVAGLRAGFAAWLDVAVDSRAVVYAMTPLLSPEVDDAAVRRPADVSAEELPAPGEVFDSIGRRGRLRVGLIDDSVPYAFVNDRRQLVGLDVEMAQQLAAGLGVAVEFVRFPLDDLDAVMQRRTVDIVMAGARLTPERASVFTLSDPYLDETLAVIVPDHARHAYRSWASVRALGALRLGMRNLPYYVHEVRGLLPEARIEIIAGTAPLTTDAGGFDAFVMPAERGSVLTMINPHYTVVVPEGGAIKMPLAYPLAGADARWVRYVNTWIALKRRDGLIDRLHARWILGHAERQRRPRWSIARDVLGWMP